MTVKVRPYKRGGWEVDIMLTIPGRPRIRERRKAPVGTKSAAKRWGEERERQLIQHYTNASPTGDDDRPDLVIKEVPTLAQFFPRYMEGYCKANRLRPSTIKTRENSIRAHLLPAFGRKRLDRITPEDLQRFKAERAHLATSTVNLMLTFLSGMLTVATEWGVIARRPVKVRKLKQADLSKAVVFYDFGEFDRLVLAAEKVGKGNHVLTVLLGGEAGLRCGEMMALLWTDIDLRRGTLTVERQVWRGHEGPPKGGHARVVPLAPRLCEALASHRHFEGPNVLWSCYRRPPSAKTVSEWLHKVQRAASLVETGPHMLRRTFCSHLAINGVSIREIQELAGHRSIETTRQYMGLAPGAGRNAIETLRRPPNWRHAGDAPKSAIKPERLQ
ncbi:MAG: site-specific integrase [Myxococcales bacterium]|nr:site-specific integrase [Myxococcales bacterium]